MDLRDIADAAIEIPIVPSFTKLGYVARQRLDDWGSPERSGMDGRVVVVTGATSGLGACAAERIAGLGATVVVVGRTAEKNERVVGEIVATTGNASVSQVACDLGDRAQVRQLAERVLADHDRLDVLIHNAGALSATRDENPDGIEATVASQVIGPFLLTRLLCDRLVESAPSRVITMSSGGMYTAPLTVSELEMSPDRYQGAKQYALAKRAQVTLTEMAAERFADSGIRFHALHPGWADTPGVEASLPGFRKVMGPLLRSPEQGADTLVWLASDDGAPLTTNGGFWHDRRIRSIHKLPTTKRSDTPDRRDRLWQWVTTRADLP